MKKITAIPALFILVSLYPVLPSYSVESKISTVFETGKRSATDYLDDRDLSSSLNVYRQSLRLDQKLSKDTKYNISYEHYYKDYDTLGTLSSISNQWAAGFDHLFESLFPNPLKLKVDAGLKYKDYKNSPSSDYERSNAAIGLDYGKEDFWSIKWDNGFINYSYDKSERDELKLFTQLSAWAKFLDGRLKISPSYKFQSVEVNNGGADRSENTVKLASSYQLCTPYFSAIGGFFESGKNDTKDSENEDRDDDLHYKYSRWYVSTEHPLTNNLETDIRYGMGRRDYSDSNNNYKNWFLEDKSSYRVYEDPKKKVDLLVTVEHREGDYDVVDSLRYIKDVISLKMSHQVKRNWELVPGFTFKKYNYHAAPLKNENDYETKVEFTKKLLSENLELNVSYKYLLKDYRNKPNITLWMVKSGIEYKF